MLALSVIIFAWEYISDVRYISFYVTTIISYMLNLLFWLLRVYRHWRNQCTTDSEEGRRLRCIFFFLLDIE
jgi:hypothetical protein